MGLFGTTATTDPNAWNDPTKQQADAAGYAPWPTDGPKDTTAAKALFAGTPNYGGNPNGPGDAIGRYQGLANTIAGNMAAKGAGQQASLNALGANAASRGQATGNDLYASATGVGYHTAQRAYGVGDALGARAAGMADTSNANAGAAYGAGQSALGLLGSAAMGQQPSAAEIQSTKGVSDAMHAQLSAAAGARGGAGAQAAAAQQASINSAGLEAGAVSSNAALRANEMANARSAYSGAANNLYGTAGSLGMNAENLSQGSRLAGTSLGGSEIMQGQQLGGSELLQGQQQGQAGQLGFTGLGSASGQAYDTLGLQGQQTYEGMANDVNKTQLQADLEARAQDLGLSENQAALGAQQTGQLIGGTTAALGTLATLAPYAFGSDERIKTGIEPQGKASPGDSGDLPPPEARTSGQDFSGGPAPGAVKSAFLQHLADLRGKGPNPLQQFGAQTMAANSGYVPPPAVAMPRPMAPSPMPPPIAPGQGMAAPLTSDVRAKRDVSPAPVADALLDTFDKSKSTFAYKDPAQQPLSPMHPRLPGARFGGVMAQDLEQVPEIGRQLVTDTPRGKTVEQAAGLSAVMMGMGRLHERLAALEGSRR